MALDREYFADRHVLLPENACHLNQSRYAPATPRHYLLTAQRKGPCHGRPRLAWAWGALVGVGVVVVVLDSPGLKGVDEGHEGQSAHDVLHQLVLAEGSMAAVMSHHKPLHDHGCLSAYVSPGVGPCTGAGPEAPTWFFSVADILNAHSRNQDASCNTCSIQGQCSLPCMPQWACWPLDLLLFSRSLCSQSKAGAANDPADASSLFPTIMSRLSRQVPRCSHASLKGTRSKKGWPACPSSTSSQHFG